MFYGLFPVGSDANGNNIYIARAYNGSDWTICKAKTYSQTNSIFSQTNIAKYNGDSVLFDDGTQPSVNKSSSPYQAPYSGLVWRYCGVGGFEYFSYGQNDSWYANYRCNSCGSLFSSEAGNGNTEYHSLSATHSIGEYKNNPAVAATRSYNISWKNRIATITLTENSMNSNSYSTKTLYASLFSQNGTNDSIITINPDNTVKIQWFATGIDSEHCDKVWIF